MKALFLIFHGFDKANGISKKIHYQVKASKNVEWMPACVIMTSPLIANAV